MIYSGGWVESPNIAGPGLIADVGPYRGSWPIAEPLLPNLPLDAAEIDYFVGLPNPDGLPDDFINGSYPTNFCGSYRYWAGAPGGATGSGHYGPFGSGGWTGGDDLPLGAHLFVVWYGNDYVFPPPQPSKPALAVVPPSWVAGGRGWDSIAHWSDWQPKFITTFLAQVHAWAPYSRLTTQGFYSTVDGGTDARDAQTIANEVRDLLMASGNDGLLVDPPRFGTDPITGDPQRLTGHTFENNPPPFTGFPKGWGVMEVGAFEVSNPHVYGYAMTEQFAYLGQNVIGSVNDDVLLSNPPGLPGDAADVPPSERGPHTIGQVDYEVGHTEFVGWISATYGSTVEMHVDDIPGFDAPQSIPLTVWWDNSNPGQEDASAARRWLGYEEGTVLDHVDIAAPVTAGNDDPYYEPSSANFTVDLSSVPLEDFCVVVQPRWMGDVDIPGPVSGATTYLSTQHFNSSDPCSFNYVALGLLPPLAAQPTGRWRLPRWRYWIEALVPPPAVGILRLNQRDDGLGLGGAPRLRARQGGASRQGGIRVGDRNTYH